MSYRYFEYLCSEMSVRISIYKKKKTINVNYVLISGYSEDEQLFVNLDVVT
jgi:hypothetical protein